LKLPHCKIKGFLVSKSFNVYGRQDNCRRIIIAW